jgi:glycosyltransferase involved in cell wall biosynthesis
MCLVSVVIPTYNRMPLLAHAVQSVLRQKDADLEIVVIDDGSTDETETYLRTFDGPLRFLRQSRTGPGAARNLGWNIAIGEYIAFLDDDDVWFPWTFKIYLRCIEKFNRPSFVAGSPCWFRSDDELGSVREERFEATHYRDYLASAREVIWLGASSMLIRRDCPFRFETSPMNGQDLDFALHVGELAGFVWVRTPLTFGYRRHGVTRIHNTQQTLDGMQHLILEERSSRFPGGDSRKKERLELITRAIRPPILEAARQNLPLRAVRLYRDTFFWHVLLKRWKFLLAAPVLILASLAKLFVRYVIVR